MGVGMTAHHYEIDLAVGKELVCGPVVLGGGEIDGAVRAGSGGRRLGRGGSLEEGIYGEGGVRGDKGEVVDFG